MGTAQDRRRELANFEVNPKPRKKSGSTTSKPNSKKASAASAAGKKGGSGGTKTKTTASKQGMKNQNSTSKRKNTIQDNPLASRNSRVYSVEEAPRPRRKPQNRDYARYDRPVRSQAPARKKHKKRRRRSPFSFLTLVLLVMIGGMVGLGAWRVQEYEEFTWMKSVVSRQTFFDGTTVEGVDVSGMTLQQGLEYWDTQVEPAYRSAEVVLNDGTRLTAEQLGYSSNYADVLSGAWNAGRSGSLEERYQRMQAYQAQPQAYDVSRSLYQDDVVRSFAASAAEQIDTEPKNASVKSFDFNTYEFQFEPHRNGRILDQEHLVQSIEAALDAGGGNVEMKIDTVPAEITEENVASQYGMISNAVTNASSSSSNRLSNIKLAVGTINGICLEPGESFSFNEVVGKRTTDRGYKTATAYSGGKVTEEVGGGICQVSTTLFNAVVKADLQIDERHSHSLTVSYVDLGKDAAVSWDSKDLRFTNTSSDRIYICGYITEDKRVRIGVFGKLLPDGTTITLEGKKTGTREFKTEYQMNFTLAPGEQRVLQKGKDGYSAVAYKVWWDANGNELRRSELCKSNYQYTTEIIEYGP